MTKTLYEIDQQIARILDTGFVVDEETGEVLDGGELLDQLALERTDKLEGVALYIKNLEALVTAIDAEEKALKKRRQAREAKIERLKNYLAASMIAAEESSLETAKINVSIRRSEAVVVQKDVALEERFLTVTTATRPDKAAIKAALKAGETVPGAYIEFRNNVTIK